MNAGDWIGGWQAQAQAPLSVLPAERSRHVGGHYIRGAWSDPWWLAREGGGWAVARRWRSREQTVLAWDGGQCRTVTVPAMDEREVVAR